MLNGVKENKPKLIGDYQWPFRICKNTKTRGYISIAAQYCFKSQVSALKRVGNKSAGIILNQLVL